jgi:hypothetical protein
MASPLTIMTSPLAIMASPLTIMPSPLTIMASLLAIMAPPLTIMTPPLTIMTPPLTIMTPPLTIMTPPLTIMTPPGAAWPESGSVASSCLAGNSPSPLWDGPALRAPAGAPATLYGGADLQISANWAKLTARCGDCFNLNPFR